MGSLVTWLPDNRRTLSWDDRRATAVLWDVDTGAIRDVAGIPGPCEMQLSADGRTLILNRSVPEGDVWLMTLK